MTKALKLWGREGHCESAAWPEGRRGAGNRSPHARHMWRAGLGGHTSVHNSIPLAPDMRVGYIILLFLLPGSTANPKRPTEAPNIDNLSNSSLGAPKVPSAGLSVISLYSWLPRS